MSILPKRSMVFATSALHCASSLTSKVMLSVELRPCFEAISAASAVPSLMSAIITCAPSAARACE
jgi:hypothetical protein